MSACAHGKRVKRSGYSKRTAEPYTGLFCPKSVRECKPEWLAPELDEHPEAAAYLAAVKAATDKCNDAIAAARIKRDSAKADCAEAIAAARAEQAAAQGEAWELLKASDQRAARRDTPCEQDKPPEEETVC